MRLYRLAFLFFVSCCSVSLLGCFSAGGGSQVTVPGVDPVEATEKAFALYDSNGDGKIADEELEACPAMLQLRTQFDPNGDGVTKEELQERIGKLFGKHAPGLVTVNLVLANRGRPLDFADVRFVPEPFLGDFVKEAVGQTNHLGRATIAIPDEALPDSEHGLNLMQVGIYRIEIDHPAMKKIDKKFGWEVNGLMRGGTEPKIDVSR